MDPNKTYYLTMRYVNGSGSNSTVNPNAGNIIQIQTKPITTWQPSENLPRPRLFATPELINQWKAADQNGEINFSNYEENMRSYVRRAVTDEGFSGRHQYCLPAATLYHMTGNTNDLNDAISIFQNIVLPRWQNEDYAGDYYRFQSENLTYCIDSLWDNLTNEQINLAAVEVIKDAKNSLSRRRFNDTDQFVSLIRSFLSVGFTFCGENALIGDTLANDACMILDEGHRRMFGGLLPMARKDLGRFGNSGGYLPDGASYEKGTMVYWINNFWIMMNMGYDMSDYAPFVANNFLSGKIHSTTPSGRGYFAHGDVQSYYYNGEWLSGEPNSLDHRKDYSANFLQQAALLDRMGDTDTASRIQKFVANKNAPVSSLRYFNFMLFEQPVTDTDYSTGLDTAFTESGYGIIFDRTSWDVDATYTVFTTAWGGFDHNASDTGNLSIYRNQEWVFNHNTGYGGASISPESYNVPRYTTKVDNTTTPFMYSLEAGGDNEIKVNYISDQLDYFVFDATNNYNSSFENAYYYDKVERAVVWFKNGATDDYIIIDYARTNDTFPENNIELNINLPSVNGRYTAINNNQAELQTSTQKSRISLTPFTGTSNYTLFDQGGIPYDYNPFQSSLYSNYLAYSLTATAPEIHNEIAIQLTDINNSYDDISNINLENWRLKAIGENLLLYPIGSLLDASTPNIDATINLPSASYKKIVIIGLKEGDRIAFNMEEVSTGQFRIQVSQSNAINSTLVDTKGILIYSLSSSTGQPQNIQPNTPKIVYAVSRDAPRTLYMIDLNDPAVSSDNEIINISEWLNTIIPNRTEDYLINISPDGSHIIVNTRTQDTGNSLYVIDLQSGRSSLIQLESGQIVRPEDYFAISNDGTIAAVVMRAESGSGTDIITYKKTGDNWGVLANLTNGNTNSNGYSNHPSFSFDSSRVIFRCFLPNITDGAFCSNISQGGDFTVEMTSTDIASVSNNFRQMIKPDYDVNNNIVFELEDSLGEVIWKADISTGEISPLNSSQSNDNTPCVFGDNTVASLWLQRPGNSTGRHEIKRLSPDGSTYEMLLTDIDISDVGIGCGGGI